MVKPQFIIVADRGSVKAYRVEETANRGRVARLVNSAAFPEAHERLQDKVTDKAGASPVRAGHSSSVAEKRNLEAETTARLVRQLSQQIVKVVLAHQAVRWSFAAPAEINAAVLNQISGEVLQRLTHNVKRNLVKLEPRELLAHFEV
jgi:hypothetical protein